MGNKKKMSPSSSDGRQAFRGSVAKISLVIFFLAYVSMGAYVFMLIETSSQHQQGVAHQHTPPTEEIRTALGTANNPSNVGGSGTGSPSDDVTQMQELMTRQVLDKLWDITENLNILYKENWTRLASDEISRFQESMQLWIKKDCNRRKYQELVTQQPTTTNSAYSIGHHQTSTTTAAVKWSYPTAFLYALSVITTLGSCPVIPESVEGKILTILYASFGIPLLLFYLTVVGSALSSCMLCCRFDSRLSRRHRVQSPQRDHTGTSGKTPSVVTTRMDPSCQQPSNDTLFHHPLKAVIKDDESIEASSSTTSNGSRSGRTIRSYWPPFLCFIMILVYIVSGTWLFSSLMSLPLMDALLLSFMLFTTMGIPDAHSAVWSATGAQLVIAFYIFIGLTLCSLCFNLIYEWLLSRWTLPTSVTMSSSCDPATLSPNQQQRMTRS